MKKQLIFLNLFIFIYHYNFIILIIQVINNLLLIIILIIIFFINQFIYLNLLKNIHNIK